MAPTDVVSVLAQAIGGGVIVGIVLVLVSLMR